MTGVQTCALPIYGVRVENSYVTLPELPGIGFEGKSDLYAEMRALAS